ncbi:riboflavin kinase [Pseudogymnoascus destructans]|uniref:Riboflavin kinase n=1 Tax=Pseudogymnoascus destructans TaxID=655981 RepID=A0A177AIU4_9PEZI|nr:riboflavin kinase [Pseudogymnoascus destructans]OAF61988.1 riboflavin kinase [Pseudogymnoascus destructans]
MPPAIKEPRATIIGPASGPEAPYPLRLRGAVEKGFGRGSKQLGIPTANLPVTSAPWISTADSGVYFGWASLRLSSSHPSHPANDKDADEDAAELVPEERRKEGWRVFPMVMSIGYNPFYGNTLRSAEVHIMHSFPADFYGSQMALSILGYIRPEYDYVDKESLVKDIREDMAVAERSLEREAWRERRADGWLWGEEE